MIKTEKLLTELSKYDNTEELFANFVAIQKFTIAKMQEEQKTLNEQSEKLEQKINQINSK